MDHHRHRHQVLLDCESSRAAQAMAEAMYGAAVYLSAIRIRRLGGAA